MNNMAENPYAPYKDLEEQEANRVVGKWHTQDPHHKDLDQLVEIIADKLRAVRGN